MDHRCQQLPSVLRLCLPIESRWFTAVHFSPQVHPVHHISLPIRTQQQPFICSSSSTSYSSSSSSSSQFFSLVQPYRIFQYHPSRWFGYLSIPSHSSIPSRRCLFVRRYCKCRCASTAVGKNKCDKSAFLRLVYSVYQRKHQSGFSDCQ